jgi:hypothetical protein
MKRGATGILTCWDEIIAAIPPKEEGCQCREIMGKAGCFRKEAGTDCHDTCEYHADGKQPPKPPAEYSLFLGQN